MCVWELNLNLKYKLISGIFISKVIKAHCVQAVKCGKHMSCAHAATPSNLPSLHRNKISFCN